MSENRIDVIEEILGAHVDELGTNFNAYRNHVYRMLRFTFALREFSNEEKEKIRIAAAFHDLGIWTCSTFDYIEPSVALAEDYLRSRGMIDTIPDITSMIDLHHSIRRCADPAVEAFRIGDLIDLSLGVFKFGLPSDFIREAKREFPNRGFHKGLVRTGAAWIVRHPLNPLPIVRF